MNSSCSCCIIYAGNELIFVAELQAIVWISEYNSIWLSILYLYRFFLLYILKSKPYYRVPSQVGYVSSCVAGCVSGCETHLLNSGYKHVSTNLVINIWFCWMHSYFNAVISVLYSLSKMLSKSVCYTNKSADASMQDWNFSSNQSAAQPIFFEFRRNNIFSSYFILDMCAVLRECCKNLSNLNCHIYIFIHLCWLVLKSKTLLFVLYHRSANEDDVGVCFQPSHYLNEQLQF